jgi:hypothetical protein
MCDIRLINRTRRWVSDNYLHPNGRGLPLPGRGDELVTRPEFNGVRRNSGFTARSGVYADRSYAAIQPPVGDTINAS